MKNEGQRDSFVFYKRIVIKDIPIFTRASLQFHFRNVAGIFRDELIFAKKDQIIIMNFETEVVRTLYSFKNPLKR
jgi:hypothetical protein